MNWRIEKCYTADFLRWSMNLPMLIRLPALTPSPVQRIIPRRPLYRHRLSPCRRLRALSRQKVASSRESRRSPAAGEIKDAM
jgi:hypothetical protein